MLFGGEKGPTSETLICEGPLPPLTKEEGFAELVSPPLIVSEVRFGVVTLILGVSKLVGIPVIEIDFPNPLPGVERVRIALLKALSLRFPDNAFSDL